MTRRQWIKRRKRISRIRVGLTCLILVCVIGLAGMVLQEMRTSDSEPVEESGSDVNVVRNQKKQSDVKEDRTKKRFLEVNGAELEPLDGMEEKLRETVEKYPQTHDFAEGYAERSKYVGKEIDLTGEVDFDEVPLFLQWDKRWGYDLYGSELIGLAGCGPTCMSMAYTYLKQELTMNPREMAEYAYDNGYYTTNGTSWDFFEEGASDLGLKGREIGLDEVKMKRALDAGGVIICSMRPGDFTFGGHFILIRGYDREGFLVNDPNSKANSEKHWTYENLSWQIKCLWSINT